MRGKQVMPVENQPEFNRYIQDAKKRAVAALVELHKTMTQDAYRITVPDTRMTGFKNGSPVLSGYYASSHNVSIGEPDFSIPAKTGEERFIDPAAGPDSRIYKAKAASSVRAKLERLKPFGITYIATGVPYARRLEGGYSRKAPAGIYNITAAIIDQKYNGRVLKI